jgi:hypothetical protein
MKAALVGILFAGSACAQDQAAVAASEAVCGSKAVAFTVKQDVTQHPTPQPEPGTALIYVVEDLGKCPNCDGGSNAFLHER